jgi:hypothetical protein
VVLRGVELDGPPIRRLRLIDPEVQRLPRPQVPVGTRPAHKPCQCVIADEPQICVERDNVGCALDQLLEGLEDPALVPAGGDRVREQVAEHLLALVHDHQVVVVIARNLQKAVDADPVPVTLAVSDTPSDP